MNNFSCSLSCTWVTIIECLFYASDSLSWDVSWMYIANLEIAWLYFHIKETQFAILYILLTSAYLLYQYG